MRRGFKSEAERIASEVRERLGCGENDPVPLDALATDLGVEIMSADQLVPIERLEELQHLQDDAFSAATLRRRDGRRVVVFNPLHANCPTSSCSTRSGRSKTLARCRS
jgi:hypothetical protein